MSRAASGTALLTPFTLQSPSIIFPSADLEQAASWSAMGVFCKPDSPHVCDVPTDLLILRQQRTGCERGELAPP